MQSRSGRRRLGNAGGQNGAFAALALNPQGAAQQSRALTNAQEANRFCVMNLSFRNAAPVVFHLEDNMFTSFNQAHFYFRCLGVADDVGERFLKNAEES